MSSATAPGCPLVNRTTSPSCSTTYIRPSVGLKETSTGRWKPLISVSTTCGSPSGAALVVGADVDTGAEDAVVSSAGTVVAGATTVVGGVDAGAVTEARGESSELAPAHRARTAMAL